MVILLTMQETVWFKPFFCCLRSACLWESSDPGSRQEGGRMLEDISILLSAKKGKLSPMELYVNRLSTDYVTLGLVSFDSTSGSPQALL